MERIVGIDLGTTNSLIAFMEGETPAVVPGAAAPEEARPGHGRPEVVDLTPHDETECLEVSELRANHRGNHR